MSYSMVDATLVLKACDSYINDATNEMQEIKERYIQQEMQPISIFGIKFGGSTRDQAIAHLEKDLWHEYNTCEVVFGIKLHPIEQLRDLCQVPGVDNIHLCAQNASILQKYLIPTTT